LDRINKIYRIKILKNYFDLNTIFFINSINI
jgi:hypothetical protein